MTPLDLNWKAVPSSTQMDLQILKWTGPIHLYLLLHVVRTVASLVQISLGIESHTALMKSNPFN